MSETVVSEQLRRGDRNPWPGAGLPPHEPVGVSVRSHLRGHAIYFDPVAKIWRYADNHERAPSSPKRQRPCASCDQPPNVLGHDACMGTIPGAVSACCGHGVEAPYVTYADGRSVVLCSMCKDAEAKVKGRCGACNARKWREVQESARKNAKTA